MKFEWDEEKNIENVRKHGVSFDVAQYAFLDDEKKLFRDESHSIKETRYYCYGMIKGKVLTVRFTLRGRNIRIIGAGYWRKGRKKYHEK